VDINAPAPKMWAMADAQHRFGKRVRELRQRRGMSQETLSFEAGLDRSYIGQVERGERNISLQNVEKLALALRLKMAELFRGV
jgi:transcriptional regulator with XRE-family HTH domain